MKVYKH